MQGVLPHIAPCQWLVVGEDDGVVLGVGLMAPLPDPAVVVSEGVVKPPGRQGDGGHLDEPTGSQGASSPRHGPLGQTQMWM